MNNNQEPPKDDLGIFSTLRDQARVSNGLGSPANGSKEESRVKVAEAKNEAAIGEIFGALNVPKPVADHIVELNEMIENLRQEVNELNDLVVEFSTKLEAIRRIASK